MELKILSKGLFDSKCYILSDQKECAIIDCGVKAENVLDVIEEKGLKARYIILTHGHVDHIFHAHDLREATGAELCLHEEELPLYSDPEKNGYALFGFENEVKPPLTDCLLKHGDKLRLGNLTLEIIHTPGHSPGSVSILCDNLLFSGDTLFHRSVGRTDLWGGSSERLVDSIQNRLFTLDGDVKVYPGHGPSTTIAYERENNPYV